ncbi:MAG TPA: DNA polymerase IV [Bacillota bacterium]|nr:DNA polymerase IV [Bacillota bacterium]
MEDQDRVIFHIDVNSAYLSFEAVYRLQHGQSIDLREIPSAVAGSQATRHGIILARSIPSKEEGVKTGEAIWEAKKKCPNLVIVPPNYPLYMCCHKALIELARDYSDRVQVFSIDECFLDMTGMDLLGPPLTVANQIRDRIKGELGFTVSIGVSTNKLLAKMGSDLKKPDAVTTLYPHEIETKLWHLPVEDLYMVGRATGPKLRRLGIHTIGELAASDENLLRHTLKSWGTMLWNYANGIEDSAVSSSDHNVIKGVGNSTTIHFDVEDKETAYYILLSLVETVAMRLRHGGFCGKVIAVSIKRAEDLTSYSHQMTLQTPTDSTKAIYEYSKQLFDRSWRGEPIRHLGVRVSRLSTSDSVQLSMFEKNREDQRKLDQAVDRIRMKYGPGAIIRSNFLWTGLAPLQGGLTDDASYPVMTSIL